MSSAIQLKNIHKYFGEYHAVSDASFVIEEGSFFSLLGPSGCGKTTILRMIAGLEQPSSGDILFKGKSVVDLPIEKRQIGMVFQNYALFPHMAVYDNIAYGLKIKKESPDKIADTVRYYLKLMNLTGLEKRMPHELSGGQQQRVALARALVTEPFLLLLDEPLSNLDVKLREEIREELMRIKSETKITTIYVTHDQSEALYLADAIAVMKEGVVQQLDSPKVIYHHPTNQYTANFVGEANFIEGDKLRQYIAENKLSLSLPKDVELFALRPESLSFSGGNCSFKGTVAEYRFYGMFSSLVVKVPMIGNIKVLYFSHSNEEMRKIDSEVMVHFNLEALVPMARS